jgi:predicted nuclease of predicted toxin-antitoxin system
MPLKLLLDENLRIGSLWQAIQKQQRTDKRLDVLRIGDSDCLSLGAPDAEIIRYSAQAERIVVSRDLRTLGLELAEWINSGQRHPGIILLRLGLSVPQIIDLLVLVSYASDAEDWGGAIRWLP